MYLYMLFYNTIRCYIVDPLCNDQLVSIEFYIYFIRPASFHLPFLVHSKIKAHGGVCIGCLWLPHETSKVVTCGWDGTIKLWD